MRNHISHRLLGINQVREHGRPSPAPPRARQADTGGGGAVGGGDDRGSQRRRRRPAWWSLKLRLLAIAKVLASIAIGRRTRPPAAGTTTSGGTDTTV